MKAYLIDPFSQTIEQVEYNGDFHQIYKFIGASTFDVATFDETGDGVYVDDEGLFVEEQEFFFIDGYPQPLAGRGLVLGVNEEGESVEPKLSLPEVWDRVSWGMKVGSTK